MVIGYWITRPRLAWARFRYYFWERANPDKPWLCPGTIEFVQTHASKSMKALEFGSGRSTRWFAGLVGHLVGVEHNTEWFEIVTKQLADAGIKNVDYRFVALNHPESEDERYSYPTIPDYVAVADDFEDASLDFAIVDGHYRNHCIRQLISKIAPGGYLLVDDVNLWQSLSDLPVPPSWRMVNDSSNGIKRCVVWQATSES